MRRRHAFQLSLLGMAVLQLLLAPARAADLPSVKAPPAPPPPPFTWTGFYLGMDYGYTWSASPSITALSANLVDQSFLGWGAPSALSASGTTNAKLDGFLAGGGLGYNWQFYDRFVAGVEADLEGAGVRGGGGLQNIVPNPNVLGLSAFAVTGAKLNRNLEYLSTVRGRLGYTPLPNLLVYATGGLAFGGVSESATIGQNLRPSFFGTGEAKGSAFENRAGWTVGAGVEYALTPALSAKVEYLYYDLGSKTLTNAEISPLAAQGVLGLLPLFVADATNVSTRYDGHLVRAGLNYRFDWSEPAERTPSGATPLLASPRFAAMEAPALGDWRLAVSQYSWAVGVNGSATARGETVGVDLSFIDLLTRTSAFPLQFAGRFEASNGPFGVYGDLIWAQLRASGSTLQLRSPFADALVAASADGHLKLTLAIGEAGLSYELARWKFLGAPDSFTSLDAYAGMRYWFVDLDLQLDVAGAATSQLLGLSEAGTLGIAKSGALQWVDPVIGLRARHEFAPGERFETRADIGGFGAGSAFSWEFYGGYSKDFEFNSLKLTSSVGYRALSVDYSKTGSDGRQNGVNWILHGPVVSLGLRF
jgi:opacity protein-like surface antigen